MLIAACAYLFAGCCASGSSNDSSARSDAAPPPPPSATVASPVPTETPAPPNPNEPDLGGHPAPPGAEIDHGSLPGALPAAAEREIAGAAHILVAYKGAENAPKTVTRSKQDAKKRADEALKLVRADEKKFGELVKKYSDDETSKPAEGRLGNFERNAMPAAFSDKCFSMQVDTISDVVETPRGFHIIKRTK